MEKQNKKIIQEGVLLHDAYIRERDASDVEYSQYHLMLRGLYDDLESKLIKIMNFKGTTVDEFVNYVSSISITPEQKRALVELRKSPVFKKVMGEAHLQGKAKLEEILGSKISADGMTFADERGARVAVKTVQELDKDFETHCAKLDELYSQRAIDETLYENCLQSLEYIYGYYISLSKGEQIPYRKISNDHYEEMEYGFHTVEDENDILKDEHDELQELQKHAGRR